MNYKPAVQITSISRKSDSKPFLGQFGDIVIVVKSPFLPLKCDRRTAESTTANFKHTQRKFSYIGGGLCPKSFIEVYISP